MTISGGEPLLHPDLGKLVEYLCTYGDRIGLLEFITNGTMIPKDVYKRQVADHAEVTEK